MFQWWCDSLLFRPWLRHLIQDGWRSLPVSDQIWPVPVWPFNHLCTISWRYISHFYHTWLKMNSRCIFAFLKPYQLWKCDSSLVICRLWRKYKRGDDYILYWWRRQRPGCCQFRYWSVDFQQLFCNIIIIYVIENPNINALLLAHRWPSEGAG